LAIKHSYSYSYIVQGRIQDFKLGGANFKNLRRAEGGTKMFGVFRVKNPYFMPTNLIFSNFMGGASLCSFSLILRALHYKQQIPVDNL
jgi:hypothetical protein